MMTIEEKLNKEIAVIFAGRDSKTRRRKAPTYHEFLSDKMMMISVIRAGVPYSLFALIKGVTPLKDSDWAVLLDVSAKSLSRSSDPA
mgnify:FL=1